MGHPARLPGFNVTELPVTRNSWERASFATTFRTSGIKEGQRSPMRRQRSGNFGGAYLREHIHPMLSNVGRKVWIGKTPETSIYDKLTSIQCVWVPPARTCADHRLAMPRPNASRLELTAWRRDGYGGRNDAGNDGPCDAQHVGGAGGELARDALAPLQRRTR